MYSTKELGIRIREARRHRSQKSGTDFTPKILAVKIGETTKWVKRLESGEFYPNWDALNFIADVCGVDLKYLIGERMDELEYEEAIRGGQMARKINRDELRT